MLNNGVRFTWNPPSSGTVKNYELRWDTDSHVVDTTDVETVAGDADHLRFDVRPGAGFTIWAQVRAQASDNSWGPWSYVLKGTGNAPGSRQKPAKPNAPSLTAGDGKLTVTWTAPADNGNSITRYKVRHRRAGTTDWTESRNAWRIADGGDLSYVISGLTNGESYEVGVQADGLAGSSPWSESTTGTPSDEVPPTVPGRLIRSQGQHQHQPLPAVEPPDRGDQLPH